MPYHHSSGGKGTTITIASFNVLCIVTFIALSLFATSFFYFQEAFNPLPVANTTGNEQGASGSLPVNPSNQKLQDSEAGTSIAYVETLVPKPLNFQVREPSQCDTGAEVCVYGDGVMGAPVMSPTHFFIKLLRSTECYVRAVGDVGIILGKVTQVSPNLFRVDYVGQQVGEYELWISCDGVTPYNSTQVPIGTVFRPWLLSDTVQGCPSKLTIWSDPSVPPRGCTHCRAPNSATLPGQWVDATLLKDQCGAQAVGAMHEWVTDKWVWAPRECVFPFVSRKDFLDHFDGVNFHLVGDSMVRGTACDLYNWLLKGYGPEVLQGPYTYNHTRGRLSSWDGLVCGFNLPPEQENLQLVNPNPFKVGGVQVHYREALQPDSYGVHAQEFWNSERTQHKYTLVLLHIGLWMKGVPNMNVVVPRFMKKVIDRYLCKQGGGAPTIDEAKMDQNSASVSSQPPQSSAQDQERCSESLPGRVVLRTSMGKLKWGDACVHPKRGFSCHLDDALMDMARKTYNPQNTWDSILLMETMAVTYSRPDRSIDSFHYFARKCSIVGRPCELDDKGDRCCFMANFPQIGSMMVTNIMLNLIWDDPSLTPLRFNVSRQ